MLKVIENEYLNKNNILISSEFHSWVPRNHWDLDQNRDLIFFPSHAALDSAVLSW